METKKLKTKVVYTALRPPRVAIFVDNTDKNWKKTVLHITEVLPSIWGGDGFILIPTDGDKIHPVFEELLKAYDPDFVLTYQRTGHDLKADDPEEFEKILESYVSAFIKRNPDSYESNIREHYEEQLLRNPYERDLDLGKELKKFILKDLAVYHYKDDIREQSLTYSGNLPHFLPKMVDVITHSDRINDLKIVELDLSNHGIDFQLMGYGTVGRGKFLLAQLHEKRMELEKALPEITRRAPDDVAKTGLRIQNLQRVAYPQRERFSRSDSSVMFKSFWNRRVDLEGIDFRKIWRSSKKKKNQPVLSDYDFFTRVPFRVSTLGLSYFFRRKDYLMDEQGNPLVVVGDSFDDYCLYYSLVRLRSKVYWIPYSRLLSDSKRPNVGAYSFILANELNHEGRESDNSEIHWTSVALSKQRRSKVPELFKTNNTISLSGYRGVTDHLVYVDNPRKVLPYLTRLYEKGNANNRSAYQFLDTEGINFIDTPLPKSFRASDPLNHKWISEISISDHLYPTADFLSEKVFLPKGVGYYHRGTTATRVSRFGIHYQCPMDGGLVSSSDNVEERLVRPMLHEISAQEIFQGFFSRKKYDIRLSDKGAYFKQVLEKFEDFAQLVELIKNEDAFKLFELYSNLKKNKSGVFDQGVFLEGERRRYVDFSSIKAILEPKYQAEAGKKATELIEYLLLNKLLERGYLLKCSYCKNCSWYRPSETSNNFVCKRCGLENLITEESLRIQAPDKRIEPLVFYKLDELFYQFWSKNGWLTAMTLSKLKSNSEGSLIFLPETEFRRKPNQEKPDFEIDLLAIVDGNLYFGEAKRDANASDSKNKLSVSQINRLIGFDKFLPLKGLVFSSYSGNWPDDVIEKFTEIEQNGKYELIKFSNDEIFK